MNVDIEELVRLETELKTQRESATPSAIVDAKANIIKYDQVGTVLQYQAAYDALYDELNEEGGLKCLRTIAPVRSGDLLQPKVLELQDCSEDDRLEKELEIYLTDAKLAKQCLDEHVTKVAKGWKECEVQCVGVKSLESTRRKAKGFCDGDVRKIADMARVSVICDTPEALEQVSSAIIAFFQEAQGVLRVKNGFAFDWMPSGYRDVKVNPVVNKHLCEIQLHLRTFFTLKSRQHTVYEWARDLNVTTRMEPADLMKNLSPDVMEEMIHLAERNWHGRGYCLPFVRFAAGQYDRAMDGFRQNLSDAEDLKQAFKDKGFKEPEMVLRLVNIARAQVGKVLQKQGKYEEAGLVCPRAVEIGEKTLGPDHPDLATWLNNRALLVEKQGNYTEAEPLYERCQAIEEKVLGPDHLRLAGTLNNRAGLLEKQGKYEEADLLYLRAIKIGEKTLSPVHSDLATWLNNRAGLLKSQGKYDEADQLLLRVIEMDEKTLGPNHPDLATSLMNRAEVLREQGKYDEAGLLFELSLDIYEQVYGHDHLAVATALGNWAELFRVQGKYTEAEPMYEQSLTILERELSPHHPDVAASLNNRALLLHGQGKYEDADPLYKQAAAINEAVLGLEHPRVASDLNNRALLLKAQGKYAEAEPLHKRSLAINEKVHGPDHREVATDLNNWASLLKVQEKHTEAVPLLERALSILTKKLGENHRETVDTRNSLDLVRRTVRAQGETQAPANSSPRGSGVAENSIPTVIAEGAGALSETRSPAPAEAPAASREFHSEDPPTEDPKTSTRRGIEESKRTE